MNQILKFGEDNGELDDYRLKLISYNIVEYLIQKFKIKYVDKVTFGDDMVTRYKAKSNSISIELNLQEDTSLYADYYSYILKIEEFFKSFGLEYDFLTNFIFVVIHEMGHAYNFNMFKDRYGDLVRYSKYINANKYFIDLAFPLYYEDSDIEYNINDNMNYYFQSSESFCEMFAFMNFYEVWCMLKSRNLI